MKLKNSLFKNIKWADKIHRVRGQAISRLNKIRLDKNEKPDDHVSYLMKKIKKNLKDEILTAYPETESLYNSISKKFKINKNSLVLTPGSDAAIKMCLDLLTEKNDKIITLNPTFAMVDIYAKIKRLKQVKINYNDNLNLDLNKLFKTINRDKVKLLIIANPNSPTGTVISNKILLKILNVCRKKNIFVLIDEAYYGFYKFTALNYLKSNKNLIICRTFSKAYGLAGCRVGFLIANHLVAQKLYNLRPMYEINSLGVMIVNEILKDNHLIIFTESKETARYIFSKLEEIYVGKVICFDGSSSNTEKQDVINNFDAIKSSLPFYKNEKELINLILKLKTNKNFSISVSKKSLNLIKKFKWKKVLKIFDNILK